VEKPHGRVGFSATSRATRYNACVRHAVVLALILLVGCGTPARKGPEGPTGRGSGSGAQAGSGASSGSGSTPIAVRDVGCPAPSCAYHAGTATYFTCTSSGSGACVHFGPPCRPADACMYDATSRTYKQCATSSEGTCAQWGQACSPASKCMFDPKDGYHRQCDEVSAGTCKRFGALCAP